MLASPKCPVCGYYDVTTRDGRLYCNACRSYLS